MPLTVRQWEDSLRQPALCELLLVRDYLDNCLIRTNGSFVAGYEVAGLNTFFHSDETRNRTKEVMEALVRSLPERSMRMQVRYEVTEGLGDLTKRYVKEQLIENPVLQALDRERLRMWNCRQEQGQYFERRLHVYFIWNPDIHHEKSEFEWRKTRKKASKWSLSASKCIERTLREHQNLLSEFESLLAGIQATLEATGMQPRRMNDEELFLEAKRALNPLASDLRPHRPSLGYESARSQIANVNIEDEQDDHLKIGGLLYSWVSLKEMPDATFPGIMRELVSQEFPLVISAEIAIPDQSRIMRTYKRRLYGCRPPSATFMAASKSTSKRRSPRNSSFRRCRKWYRARSRSASSAWSSDYTLPNRFGTHSRGKKRSKFWRTAGSEFCTPSHE